MLNIGVWLDFLRKKCRKLNMQSRMNMLNNYLKYITDIMMYLGSKSTQKQYYISGIESKTNNLNNLIDCKLNMHNWLGSQRHPVSCYNTHMLHLQYLIRKNCCNHRSSI